MGDSHHSIKAGQEYVSGCYLEKRSERGNMHCEQESVFFFKESIVYSFVNVQEKSVKKSKTMFIYNEDFYDILHFVEETKMALIV